MDDVNEAACEKAHAKATPLDKAWTIIEFLERVQQYLRMRGYFRSENYPTPLQKQQPANQQNQVPAVPPQAPNAPQPPQQPVA